MPAATAIPLWIAFLFARKKANERFTYGYGKAEDITDVIIVGLILFSAIVAGVESIDRLINPCEIYFLWAVAVAGIVDFISNEAVAVFRIRVGREIQSTALIADGYHARVDGLISLAVVFGAIGVAAGFPLADPIVGLVITALIFGIVWQSARAGFTRLLDGVDPEVTAELRHCIEHVPGIVGIHDNRVSRIGTGAFGLHGFHLIPDTWLTLCPVRTDWGRVSARSLSLSKYPRSCLRKLTSQIRTEAKVSPVKPGRLSLVSNGRAEHGRSTKFDQQSLSVIRRNSSSSSSGSISNPRLLARSSMR